jgi:mxaJ protein
MSSPCLKKVYCLILVTLLSFAATAGAQVLRICSEPQNLPMSQQRPQAGYEIEVAQLLAAKLGWKLEIKWVAQRDHSFFKQTIGSGVCDAIMGVPAEFSRLSTTIPWYKSGFEFMSLKKKKINPRNFDDPGLKELLIGVPATGLGDTPAGMALTRRGLVKNIKLYSIYEPQTLVKAVLTEDINVAILWGPFAGWYAAQSNTELILEPTPRRDGSLPLEFDISIGVKKGNDSLRERLNQVLTQNRPAIQNILEKWHVPMRHL